MMRRRGFTLLEVMVAVAILAMAFTAIFASEAGAIKAGYRARHMGVATLLARCKMGEIEEHVAKQGLPAVEMRERDGCCAGAEIPGFSCESRIERIVLPNLSDLADPDSDTANAAEAAAAGDQASLDELMQGAGATGDAISEIAVGMAFPVIQPALEEQVRRATVTVQWKEGKGTHSFDVVQYLVAAPMSDILDPDQMPMMPGGPPPGGAMPGDTR
jgi:general secretion pathway protein I